MATDKKKKKKAAPKPAPSPAMGAIQREEYSTPAPATVSAQTSDLTRTEQSIFGAVQRGEYLPPAFLPVRQVVDASGNVIAVDINGKDQKGNVVKEAPAEARKPAGVAGATWALKPDGSYELQVGGMPATQWNQGVASGSIRVEGGQTMVGEKAITPGAPTTSIDVIKAGLRSMGLKGNIIDSGATFVQSLITDGIDFDNAVDVFLENKEYTFKNGTKLESPFYKEYGYLNEYAMDKKDPSELFGFVSGMDNLVKKYNISPKFASREKLIEATKNDVSVKILDERANIARLKAITADPVRVDALKQLGYIKTSEDLTDFYLDTSIGVEEFENRRRTAYLTTEALRRASAGITIDTARMQQLAATLGAQGYTAEQVQNVGTQAYETIAQQLPELTKLSGIFDRGQAAKPQDIQKELESEQLLGMASQRRKRLEEANINIFSGEAGRARIKTGTAGLI